MKNRIKAPALALVGALALSGCDALLDVDNPNSLVEESVRTLAAANAFVNGAERLVAGAVSAVWQAPLVASDELYWIGSRDAWGQLDQGFLANNENEFLDGAFPAMGRATWMAREAVEVLTEHVATAPGVAGYARDLARANMYAGMIYMIVGEIQEDMTFSDKQADGPPIGAANMFQVLDDAIAYYDAAITGFNALGTTADVNYATQATALRARAKMSRVIWDELNPTATVGGALPMASAAADASAVIAAVSGDYRVSFTYNAATQSSDIAGWINQRKENQVDLSLVTVTAANDINGIALNDPITGADDEALINHLNLWKGGTYTSLGDQYAPVVLASVRLMHLIVAENALAGSDIPTFTTAINAIRALDGQTAFDPANAAHPTDLAMLQHTRRVNTILMGLRLQDMFRWGIVPTGNPVPGTTWSPTSAAAQNPGEMLPITIIEIRANCHLNTQVGGPGC